MTVSESPLGETWVSFMLETSLLTGTLVFVRKEVSLTEGDKKKINLLWFLTPLTKGQNRQRALQ